MFDPAMSIRLYHPCCPPSVPADISRVTAQSRRRRSRRYPSVRFSASRPEQGNENGDPPDPKKIVSAPAHRRSTVGIIGGVSVFSTLVFLEKLVWWSTRDGGECLPFVACSDPAVSRFVAGENAAVVDSLQRGWAALERGGAGYLVMPCHVCHSWFSQISDGCALPFLHVGECVAMELREAELKPLESGSRVRIGLLGGDATLAAGFYQEKLESQGFEVVVPDRATMEHIMVPAAAAVRRKDREGARNLVRIGLRLLLVRAVNKIIVASDEMQGLLPSDDPLLQKCIDPMDALARFTIRYAENPHQKT